MLIGLIDHMEANKVTFEWNVQFSHLQEYEYLYPEESSVTRKMSIMSFDLRNLFIDEQILDEISH